MIAYVYLALYALSPPSACVVCNCLDTSCNGPRSASPSRFQAPHLPESDGRGTPDELLAGIKSAVHFDREPSAGCLLTGTARLVGVDLPFSLQFDGNGKWIEKVGSPATTTCFDGTKCCSSDEAGATTMESQGTATEARYFAALLSDAWLGEGTAVSATPIAGQAPEHFALDVQLPGTDRPARIVVSSHTLLPTEAYLPGMYADQVVRILRWTRAGAMSVPSSVEVEEEGETDTYTIEHAKPIKDYTAGTYLIPKWEATDTLFDPSVPEMVETTRCEDGHILVHPVVSGRDVGWFMVDTGAGSMCVDSAVGDSLGLRALRPTRLFGIAGRALGTRCRIPLFTLGPMSIRNLPCDTMDLSAASKALGRKIAGIVGYDVFRRAVVEIPPQGAVRIRKPGMPIKGATPLAFEGGTPVVALECERGAGMFMIDTGSNAPVVFFSPFVQRTRLLEGRDITKASATGVGGEVPFKVGVIGWVQFCSIRVKDRPAAFAGTDRGVWANKYLSGSIGQGILGLCDVTFDYGNGEVLVKPADGQTCFGDDTTRRSVASPGAEWVLLVTQRTFYQRHLDPGETVAFDVLEPDKVDATSYAGGITCRIDTLRAPNGVKVVFAREKQLGADVPKGR